MTRVRHDLNSLDDTKRLADALAGNLRGGESLLLEGELGSGKTSFCAYLARSLGSSVPASSPTYVLQHEYPCATGLVIEHWDLYRITELPQELEEQTLPTRIRLIEWADRFPQLQTQASLRLQFVLGTDGSRAALVERF